MWETAFPNCNGTLSGSNARNGRPPDGREILRKPGGSTAHCRIEIDEKNIPVSEAVSSACDLLGLDPLFVANEGVMVIILPEKDAKTALRLIRENPFGRHAQIIGRVTDGKEGEVMMQTVLQCPRLHPRRFLKRIQIRILLVLMT